MGAIAYAFMGVHDIYDAYYGFPCIFSFLLFCSAFFIDREFDGDAK